MPVAARRSSASASQAVIVEILDLSDTWYSIDQIELMLKRLKTLRLYRPNLLYRGIDGRRVANVRKFGTDQNQDIVFCSKEQDMLDPCADPAGNAFQFATEWPTPAIIVYNPDLLVQRDEYAYAFAPGVKPLPAVLAVFVLD